MSFSFGHNSIEVQKTLCDELKTVTDGVIQVYDVTLLEGHRTKEVQDSYYPERSKVQWPNSKHNRWPSDAVDSVPFVHKLADVKIFEALTGHPRQVARISGKTMKPESLIWRMVFQEFATMKGVYLAVAAQHGISLRFGDDWDRDFDRLDQTFNDLPHIEVYRG